MYLFDIGPLFDFIAGLFDLSTWTPDKNSPKWARRHRRSLMFLRHLLLLLGGIIAALGVLAWIFS